MPYCYSSFQNFYYALKGISEKVKGTSMNIFTANWLELPAVCGKWFIQCQASFCAVSFSNPFSSLA
jgi:hypothetical protein